MKWTRERILETDWSKKSWAETIRACYEHHQELNEAGIFEERNSIECPACRKCCSFSIVNSDYYCPLGNPQIDYFCDTILCCNGLWLKYDENRTRENAEAMTEYIRQVAERLEAEENDST